MTETHAVYIVSCQPSANWHCHKCGHILGAIIEGKCKPVHDVILSYDAPTVVVCPVCKTEERWYNRWDGQGQGKNMNKMINYFVRLSNGQELTIRAINVELASFGIEKWCKDNGMVFGIGGVIIKELYNSDAPTFIEGGTDIPVNLA